jgi:hypothetical protein
MTLLPHRQSIEPMNPEQPPKKKRIFYDRINEEDSYHSDESLWDDTSSNHSTTAVVSATGKIKSTTTIRSLFVNNNGTINKSSKRASRGIRDLFQSSNTKDELQNTTRKKRESTSKLFTSNHNRKQVKKSLVCASHLTKTTYRSIKLLKYLIM